jgi:NAD(P)-dependent dehydrogenase (short-subunit alcohol dehydrogenase family)
MTGRSEGSERSEHQVALVTGGAGGIGAAVARRLAARGAAVVVTDVDHVGAEAVAAEVGGTFVPCDVRDLDANRAAVAAAVERYGGLDIAFLNAGIPTGTTIGDDFDVERYRRAMAVNLDGVVYGVVAALPALRERGGGDIVVTASLAGLTSVPFDPVYGANKHAVVGLVRGLGPVHEGEGIRVNAVCPSFAETRIIDDIRQVLAEGGVPLLSAEDVADAVLAILDAKGAGECWFVQPGRPSEPFTFRNVPGPR